MLLSYYIVVPPSLLQQRQRHTNMNLYIENNTASPTAILIKTVMINRSPSSHTDKRNGLSPMLACNGDGLLKTTFLLKAHLPVLIPNSGMGTGTYAHMHLRLCFKCKNGGKHMLLKKPQVCHLKKYCKENKMKGYSKFKKADLITFILKYEFD